MVNNILLANDPSHFIVFASSKTQTSDAILTIFLMKINEKYATSIVRLPGHRSLQLITMSSTRSRTVREGKVLKSTYTQTHIITHIHTLSVL